MTVKRPELPLDGAAGGLKARRSRARAAVLGLVSALALCACAGKAGAGSPILDGSALFTERDLRQTPETDGAVRYAVADGEIRDITAAGVYVLSGTASEACIRVAAEDAAVQLVLDGLHITNTGMPCIYAEKADKVFLTAAGESSLLVTGVDIRWAGEKADGAVYARSDLVLNGEGSLTVVSGGSGIVSRDALKITGGSYVVTAGRKAFAAGDAILIAAGSLRLEAGTDGLHAENGKDGSLGYIYISGGDLTMSVGDDAIHASSLVQIDGGRFEIAAAEGIEGTYIQLNGGRISIHAWGDGINAAHKSAAYRPTLEVNGGEIAIVMDAGDTDAVDSNGDIVVRGGALDIRADHPFDFDGSALLQGGTVTVNGKEVKELSQ